jgi:hypothetical protein
VLNGRRAQLVHEIDVQRVVARDERGGDGGKDK